MPHHTLNYPYLLCIPPYPLHSTRIKFAVKRCTKNVDSSAVGIVLLNKLQVQVYDLQYQLHPWRLFNV